MSSKKLQHSWVVRSKIRNVPNNTVIITLEHQGFLTGSFSDNFAYDFAVFSELPSEFQYSTRRDDVTTTCILTFTEDDIDGGYMDELFSLLIANSEAEFNADS